MTKEYDEEVRKHYIKVAKKHALLGTSTMEDEITRDLETKAIFKFIEESLKQYQLKNGNKSAVIMDIGCGNGYTLECLSKRYPDNTFVGVEKSEELRELAISRFLSNENVNILEGDIRDKNFSKDISPDILVCQRVLINLLDIEDQKLALNNIVELVPSHSTLLFIEGFESSLERLNEARSEFDLSPIPQAYLNLFLSDDFFNKTRLKDFVINDSIMSENFLSTHYYVTRIIHEILTPENKAFKRNSEFVKFFTKALKQNTGDYAPLKLFTFKKE